MLGEFSHAIGNIHVTKSLDVEKSTPSQRTNAVSDFKALQVLRVMESRFSDMMYAALNLVIELRSCGAVFHQGLHVVGVKHAVLCLVMLVVFVNNDIFQISAAVATRFIPSAECPRIDPLHVLADIYRFEISVIVKGKRSKLGDAIAYDQLFDLFASVLVDLYSGILYGNFGHCYAIGHENLQRAIGILHLVATIALVNEKFGFALCLHPCALSKLVLGCGVEFLDLVLSHLNEGNTSFVAILLNHRASLATDNVDGVIYTAVITARVEYLSFKLGNRSGNIDFLHCEVSVALKSSISDFSDVFAYIYPNNISRLCKAIGIYFLYIFGYRICISPLFVKT